jgi:pyridoxamine 5'-phosphate oxidase
MTVGFESILSEFNTWFAEASAHPDIVFPEAMNVATSDASGIISSRMVLMKQASARGFIFFTNYLSHKSVDIGVHPQVALCFYWQPLGKQVRIQGTAHKVSEAESDAYFQTRPRESQIGAWASEQSEMIESRAVLLEKFKAFEARFDGKDVPRPPHWGGWLVVPNYIEFWQEGDHRLHERNIFRLDSGMWIKGLLNP